MDWSARARRNLFALARGRAPVIRADRFCLGYANRRETLRFCCIGSIHVDRGNLFRCLLRNAAPGDDLETALDRRAQKRAVMLTSASLMSTRPRNKQRGSASSGDLSVIEGPHQPETKAIVTGIP